MAVISMHLFDILSALLLLDTSLSLTHLNLYSKIKPKHASTRLLLSSIEENSDELGDDVFGASVGPLPSVSSRINFGETVVNCKYDLWVVGAGLCLVNYFY